jgi:plastocyanin
LSRGRVPFVVVALWSASAIFGSATARTFDLRGTVSAGGRPEPDAVVWLDAPDADGPRSDTPVVLDQRSLSFFPRVLAVRAGTTVDLPNNDRVFHNVFSFHDGKRFDLGVYPVGMTKQVRFDKPGLSRIFCNIHPNMAAYVKAVDSPYFAVSDRDGRFTIAAVPEGTYSYHAWRPGRQDLTGSATLNADSLLALQWR